ncbi:MAG: 30S ribosomal protein S6 [Chloroflexi bacterium]|nr:30S ribosomal protein S6 [Chloroflexota bacterium]
MTSEQPGTQQTPVATDSRLRDYELMLILKPDLEAEALDAAIASVEQFITGKGGIVVNVDRWGKRRLAYSLKRFLEGHYVLARFKMAPEWSKQLESSLLISEEVLRHLLVRLEE